MNQSVSVIIPTYNGIKYIKQAIDSAISQTLPALEIIVVLVQAYVFTLLTAVFVGMAINVHH